MVITPAGVILDTELFQRLVVHILVQSKAIQYGCDSVQYDVGTQAGETLLTVHDALLVVHILVPSKAIQTTPD